MGACNIRTLLAGLRKDQPTDLNTWVCECVCIVLYLYIVFVSVSLVLSVCRDSAEKK
jgi:hypothetical protein